MPNENLRRDEAAERSTLISPASYDVTLDVRRAADPAIRGYTSRSVISFSAARPGASTFLDFIGSDVQSVVLNGADLPVAEVVDGARIRLDNLQADNQVSVTGTALYSSSGEGMHRFVDPADGQCYLYTQYEPADARRVFANFEQPDLKATFTFHVMAPADWRVASNETETNRTPLTDDPASACWDFAPTKPMSTYITTVLAGPYFMAEDRWQGTPGDDTSLEVPLALYCRASMADSFDTGELFRLTKNGLDFFNRLFDYPYPWGKYDQAFVPEYNLGAMENPGLVTFTEGYVFTSRATDAQYQARATTLMHEMAHMWFGNLVTMQWWDDLWLKESFADYMGTLGVDQATGWETAWVNFANKRKAGAYVQDQLPTTHPIVADIPDLEAAKQNFDGITYAKGAAVLKQLVAYVGFEAFIAGTRSYFRRHAFGTASLSDLLAALSASSGRDLKGWAQQWLQSAGISTLSLDIASGANDGVLGSVAIVQEARDPVTGRTDPYSHRLRIGRYDFSPDGALVRTGQIEADVTGSRTELPELAGLRRPALLVVNDDDLSYAKVRLDPASEAAVLASLDRIQDPMARALCWTALWHSVRDAESPAPRYVQAAAQFSAAEPVIGVLLNVLDNAYTAVERYTPAPARQAVRSDFLASMAANLDRAEPGSDQQLAWVRTVATASRHDGTFLPRLNGLLTGATTIPGLAVDAELRWHILHALAANGRASVRQLDAELARDNTASGRAGHATALAARPDGQAKAVAWEAAVHGNELSNQLLTATITGFTTAPAHLLEPYVEPYFRCLRDVWAGRSIEMAGRIVRGLYPLAQDLAKGGQPAEHPVVRRTDEWLAGNPDAPPALRRIIVEQRDHLLRALAAQAAAVPAAEATR